MRSGSGVEGAPVEPRAGAGPSAAGAFDAVTAVNEVSAYKLLGARLLAAGKRRAALEAALGARFEEDFAGRMLPFDSGCAPAYAAIAGKRRSDGRPISRFDAQIAAIATRQGTRLAARNVGDFDGCGLAVVNPWLRIA